MAIIGCQFAYVNGSLWIFTVHMKYGYHEHLGDIGRISGRTGIFRQGCITDLVIDDDMDGAPGFIPLKLRHVQCLGNHSLPGKSGITVNKYRNHAIRTHVRQILPGSCNTLCHGIHGFQMTGIVHQKHAHVLSGSRLNVCEITIVVFDITGSHELPRVIAALKLPEYFFVGLPQDVGLNIQPSPVGHPQNDFPTTIFGNLPDQCVQQGDHHITPLQ